MNLSTATLNMGAALLLGAAIGFERQWRQRLAGLRTNTLVALGAAIFVVFGGLFPGEPSPTRVAAQVVSGIGFLGAGIIFREGLNVRGLNTAATLWCSAAIGVVAGAGALSYAAVATLFVVGVNLVLRPLVDRINGRMAPAAGLPGSYAIHVICAGQHEAQLRALLLQGVMSGGLHLRRLDSANIEGSDRVEVTAALSAQIRVDSAVEQIVGRLSLEPAVTAARWSVEPGEE